MRFRKEGLPMEAIFYTFGGVIALVLLAFIAEPYRFMPEGKRKKKTVGSSYWGIYEGAAVTEVENATVEVPQPARKLRYTLGSSTYAKGRGVNMSGRS
jgi:hypothetical protein